MGHLIVVRCDIVGHHAIMIDSLAIGD